MLRTNTNQLARARYINSWGLENPRLDRLQGLAEFPEGKIKDNLGLGAGEFFSFYISRTVLARLTSMWNGRVVYQRHWKAFFQDMRDQWLRVAALSMVIWLGGCVILASGIVNVTFIASTVFSGVSAFISLVLYNKHGEYALSTGPDISRYIMSVESYHHGLRPLSLVFVLPQALTVYSAGFFNVALIVLALDRVRGVIGGLMVIGIVVLAGTFVVWTFAFFDRSLEPLVRWMMRPLVALKSCAPRRGHDPPKQRSE